MKKLAIILVLWLPFSIAALLSVPISLAAIMLEENIYGKDVLRAMDKLLAALCGFSGYFTLSAECGVATEQPWAGLRWVLDKIQAGHCEGAAKNEGLT
jgi:hypothetical protein